MIPHEQQLELEEEIAYYLYLKTFSGTLLPRACYAYPSPWALNAIYRRFYPMPKIKAPTLSRPLGRQLYSKNVNRFVCTTLRARLASRSSMTQEMLISLAPCEIISMFMPCSPSVLKKRPLMPTMLRS